MKHNEIIVDFVEKDENGKINKLKSSYNEELFKIKKIEDEYYGLFASKDFKKVKQ